MGMCVVGVVGEVVEHSRFLAAPVFVMFWPASGVDESVISISKSDSWDTDCCRGETVLLGSTVCCERRGIAGLCVSFGGDTWSLGERTCSVGVDCDVPDVGDTDRWRMLGDAVNVSKLLSDILCGCNVMKMTNLRIRKMIHDSERIHEITRRPLKHEVQIVHI